VLAAAACQWLDRHEGLTLAARGGITPPRVGPPARRHAYHRGENAVMAVDHYENFPVASLLCPAPLRPAVVAIYRYARTADDLADEGDATVAQRLADLQAYEQDLLAVTRGGQHSGRWPAVFDSLAPVILRHALPGALLGDLLSAFKQDVVQQRYADRAELMDYCRRSANPVGRLLLHLYGVSGPSALHQSDAICTALQLINFWQDLSLDLRRGRLYLPLADCARHGVDADALLAGQDSLPTRRLMADESAWARSLMLQGSALPAGLRQHVDPVHGRLAAWRLAWELRLVMQGGLRILERIAAHDHDSLAHRPVLRPTDWPLLWWRAWRTPAAARI